MYQIAFFNLSQNCHDHQTKAVGELALIAFTSYCVWESTHITTNGSDAHNNLTARHQVSGQRQLSPSGTLAKYDIQG